VTKALVKGQKIEIPPDVVEGFLMAYKTEHPKMVIYERDVEIFTTEFMAETGAEEEENYICNSLIVAKVVQFKDYFHVRDFIRNNVHLFDSDIVHGQIEWSAEIEYPDDTDKNKLYFPVVLGSVSGESETQLSLSDLVIKGARSEEVGSLSLDEGRKPVPGITPLGLRTIALKEKWDSVRTK
jgi:hypothetical protein